MIGNVKLVVDPDLQSTPVFQNTERENSLRILKSTPASGGEPATYVSVNCYLTQI